MRNDSVGEPRLVLKRSDQDHFVNDRINILCAIWRVCYHVRLSKSGAGENRRSGSLVICYEQTFLLPVDLEI